nr:ferrous iron transport protein A [Desulfoscipio gibsoniae]
MTLDKVRRGDMIKIVSIGSAGIKENALRMGINEGAVLTCAEVIPAGPVVLGKHRQEIAIGRNLARSINVELLARVGEARSVNSKLSGEPC